MNRIRNYITLKFNIYYKFIYSIYKLFSRKMDIQDENFIIDLDNSDENSLWSIDESLTDDTKFFSLNQFTKRTLLIDGDRQFLNQWINSSTQSFVKYFEKINSDFESFKEKFKIIENYFERHSFLKHNIYDKYPVIHYNLRKPNFNIPKDGKAGDFLKLMMKVIHFHYNPEPIVDNRIRRGRPEQVKDLSLGALRGLLLNWEKQLKGRLRRDQRSDALFASVGRYIKKIPDLFLKYIGSKCQYKSKWIETVLKTYLKWFLTGFLVMFSNHNDDIVELFYDYTQNPKLI